MLWILIEDFNCIRVVHEKRGGESPNFEAMEEFNKCIHDMELEDLKWWGQKFTWWNKQEDGGRIECKLNRALANGEWKTKFSWFNENFLLPGIYHHSPCIVSTGESKDSSPKPFRFFDMWKYHEDFLYIVEEAWKIEVKGDPMYAVGERMKSVKAKLKRWNREVFGRIDVKVENLRRQMFQVQDARRIDPSNIQLAKLEKEVTNDYIN